ncbi:DNA binding domain-containing protein, excisionase family [Aeromicrobium sp. 9AM]|nr:BldC family transcriptional regulator [Aeromicrobium sp. 9AM]VXB15134.1 DNA binding domain-containing protein, excisionase family [Aeromicrobium sp. 9AM]
MAERQAPPEQLLTPAEVAALVYVDPKTVSRWAKAGKIPATRTPGGHRRFRWSDVQSLMPKNPSREPLPDKRSAIDLAVAEAVKIALEAQAESAVRAAARARRARALAASEAARLVAGEAACAAADMRSRGIVQASRLAEAAAQAKRLVSISGTEAHSALAAVRMAETVQAAADAASADTAGAAARVAQAVTDTAAHVAVIVAECEESIDRETTATAEALHRATETARVTARSRSGAARVT